MFDHNSLRRPLITRLREIRHLLAVKGQVSVEEMAAMWALDFSYVRRIMRLAAARYQLPFDGQVLTLTGDDGKQESEAATT